MRDEKSRVFITGDTHGLYDFGKLLSFADQHPELNKEDYVIICGDFGGVWDDDTESVLEKYSELPFTILFVDGNHENYDRLAKYPKFLWKGGMIQRIKPDIIHLLRGQVYSIAGKTFFTFGGAESHDKAFREYGIDIWEQEIPCSEDVREAERNLEKVGWKVDYVITHSCDSNALLAPILSGRRRQMKENRILSFFEERLEYQHWYFGHYHKDGEVNNKKTVLYQNVIPLI